MDALSQYTRTKLKVYGSSPIHGTFSLIVAWDLGLPTKTFQTCSFPSRKAPTMTQHKRQQSLHLANL